MSKKKIALLSNVTVDFLVAKLKYKYEFYLLEGFDTWVQEAINSSSRLYSEPIDAIVILIDGTEARGWKKQEEGAERIIVWKQAINEVVRNLSNIPIFISSIDFRENRIKSISEKIHRFEVENDWYQFVHQLGEKSSNVYFLDIKDIIVDLGRKQFYSNKMWYMSSMPYSREGLNAIAYEIDRVLSSCFLSRKKIIVLDLDNTIWGGVIGEDGIDNIDLADHKEGQRFFDFQRQLVEMKNRGVLLAICSKNNKEEAEFAIENHPSMLLRLEDFVCRKINWQNKAINIKEIERELNISEGGFIFIDDNPIEQETVKGECPEVLVPAFPQDTSELIGFAEKIWLDYCQPLQILDEDEQRTKMYQNEAKRNQELCSSLNLEEYISKLEIVIDIHKMRKNEIERVSQLINKTNQFNVTTKRYTQAEIENFYMCPSYSIYVAYSSDKFGNDGLISVIILKNEEASVKVDSFLMSCRVMGRRIEDVIINEMVSRCSKAKMFGEYIPTNKNTPVKNIFERFGFDLISDNNGHKTFEISVANYKKKEFDFFKEIRFEE